MTLKIYLNAEFVRRLLARRNRSLLWLATELRTSKYYVTALLSKERAASPEMRRRIVKVLSPVSWDSIFVMEEKK